MEGVERIKSEKKNFNELLSKEDMKILFDGIEKETNLFA
jgi:hypothetical protein